MSHFCVIVAGTDEQSEDSRLEEYSEQDENFFEKEIEVAKTDIPAEALDIMRRVQESINAAKEKGQADWQKQSEDNLAEYQKLHDAGNDAEIVKLYTGYEQDEDGNFYSEYNPDAKWDWYEVGGRWTGFFQLKPNTEAEPVIGGHYSMKPEENELLSKKGRTDVAKVKDIDWDAMRAINRAEAEDLWDKYEEDLKNPVEKRKHAYFEFGVENGDTRDKFIKRRSSIAPFAVLDDDGWHERGSMGWFGMVDNADENWEEHFENKLNEWIEKNPEMELTIVDCHI